MKGTINTMKASNLLLLLTLLLTLLLAACGSATDAPTGTDPNQPVSSDDPIPVEPDGGIGDGAGPPKATPGSDEEFLIQEATVESIDILIMESFPLQVRVVARGSMASGCAAPLEITQAREGNTFKVTIFTQRPARAMCPQTLSPFEESIALDVAGLPAGEYTVNVNGVTDTFTFTQDN